VWLFLSGTSRMKKSGLERILQSLAKSIHLWAGVRFAVAGSVNVAKYLIVLLEIIKKYNPGKLRFCFVLFTLRVKQSLRFNIKTNPTRFV
jgi:hypothetical protein